MVTWGLRASKGQLYHGLVFFQRSKSLRFFFASQQTSPVESVVDSTNSVSALPSIHRLSLSEQRASHEAS